MTSDEFYETSTQMNQGWVSESPSQSASKKKSAADTQKLVHATVRQLLDANATSEESFIIDGAEVSMVTFVGKIVHVESKYSNITYLVDDGTGCIEVKIWIDVQNDKSLLGREKDQWLPGVYVRVFGNMRQWQKKNSIVGFRIRKITDFNEITYHFLESIKTHLYHTSGPLNSAGAVPQQQAYINDNMQQSGQNNSIESYDPDIFYGITDTVKALRKTPKQGVHIQAIYDGLRSQFDEQTIKLNIEKMLDDGFIYTVQDGEHLAVQDSLFQQK